MAHPKAITQHWETVRTLSKPGQALAPQAPTATVRNPQWFTQQGNTWRPKNARKELHKRLITEHRDQHPHVKNQRKAIILAGPPGAGKSTMLNQLLGHQREQFLVIDADEFKKSLLQEAHHDGSYNSWILPNEVRQREAAGERFFPLELASLVHEESAMIARQMRTEAIIDGTNIAIDTVLSSETAAIKLGKQLTTAGYDVQIIDIEVPYEISEKRITQRWQHSYEQALANENTHGGRWVPSEYTRTIFDGPHGMSQPEANAQKLAHQCPAVSRYRVHRTTIEATETTPATSSWEKDLVRSEYGAALTHHTSTFTELWARTEEFEEPVP